MAKQPDSWHRHVIEQVLPRMEAAVAAPPAITGLTPGPANAETVNVGFQSLQPGFDVIERLPPAAAEKLRLLRQRAADAHAIIPEFEQVRQASLAKIEAANALKRLTDHPQDGGFNLPDDNGSVIAARRALDKSTDDFERLKQSREYREAAYQLASGATVACEDFLRHAVPGNCKIAEFKIEPPKSLKGETELDAVERLRRRGRELKADLHRIRSAPFPSAYCKQRARGMIEALAQRGQPDVSLLIEHDGDIVWPTKRVKVEVHNAPGAIGFAEIPDLLAIDAWLRKSELIAALDREISTEADDPAALSHEQRQKAEAETMGDLLAVEREEAALTWAAIEQRLPVEFRADISPQAVLGVVLITTPRADASPETSPGLSWPWRR